MVRRKRTETRRWCARKLKSHGLGPVRARVHARRDHGEAWRGRDGNKTAVCASCGFGTWHVGLLHKKGRNSEAYGFL